MEYRFVNNKSLAFKLPGVIIEHSMPAPKKRILVVDDEPLVCDAVKMMLVHDGHDVVTASDGQEALAVFDKNKFDLVITDFGMPGMKGDELAATIKARAPRQPVVMITAYAEMLQSSGTQLPGVDFLVSKPFLLEHLREAISTVLPDVTSQKGGAQPQANQA